MNEHIPQEIKRGPGRPKQMETISNDAPVKKGKRTWKPAALNEFHNKEAGYVYRMLRKDPDNLAKKAAEGWELCSAIQGGNTKHIESGRMNDGKSITSIQEGKDWVLGRITEDMAIERQDYYRNETDRRTSGLTAHIKKEAAKEGTDIHGNITISSRNGTQVIE